MVLGREIFIREQGNFRLAMPIFEFRCKKCRAVTEVFCSSGQSATGAVTCGQCGSRATAKVISRVSVRVARPAKYSEDFLHRARPFLRTQKQTGEIFAEGKGSDDARTFQLAEQIGQGIDRALATRLPSRRR
jgi:putative FmdB family regulatory protein